MELLYDYAPLPPPILIHSCDFVMAAKDSVLLQENPDAWSSSWEMATATFTAAATAAGARLERLSVDPALDGTPLWVDVAVWGTSTTHILLYTAGIHGVEGYAGSAVLIDLCQQMQQHATSDAVKKSFLCTCSTPPECTVVVAGTKTTWI